MKRTVMTLIALVALQTILLVGPLRGELSAPGEPLCTQCDRPALYAKRASLQETLLVTRQRHAAWLAAQSTVRPQIEWGPWHVTSLLPSGQADQQVRPTEQIDVAANGADGKALWSQRSDLPDGQSAGLLGGCA